MSAAPTADAEAAGSGLSGVLKRAFALNTLGPLGALVLACLFFSIRSDRFFTGAGFGLLNGGLVTSINLPPFIVTLGTLNIAFALTHIYSNEQTVSGLPTEMTWFGNTFRIGQTDITYGTVLMLVMYAAVWFVLRQTAAGQHVYAVGNEPEAARLTGIRTRRV